MNLRTVSLGGAVLLLVSCGDIADVDPSTVSGVWRSESAVSNGVYTALLRITIRDVDDPNDLRGSWAWGLNFGGGVTGGVVDGSSVTIEMRDFDTLQQFGFSGRVESPTRMEGSFQGISVVLTKS